jgi:invasion protein IalB
MKSMILKSLAVLLMATPVASVAEESAGQWSIDCLNDDCIATLTAKPANNDSVWTKLVISSDEHRRVELQVKTPRATDRFAFGFDGKQYGLGFYDSCDQTSCEGSLHIDADLREKLATSRRMFITFMTSNDGGEMIEFSLYGAASALKAVVVK